MIGRDEGYTTIELLIVMSILGIVLGGIVTLFTAGINADASQNLRFQSQQEAQLALTKLRKDVHSACTIAAPGTCVVGDKNHRTAKGALPDKLGNAGQRALLVKFLEAIDAATPIF